MQKKKEDIIKDTVEFWKKRTDKEFSPEDAKEIINNISGFFQILAEWDRKDKEQLQDLPKQDQET